MPTFFRPAFALKRGDKPTRLPVASLISGLILIGGIWPASAQLPPGWADQDIGIPSQTGSASQANGLWTVSGGGNDIWNASDNFHYAYESSSANAVIIVRVTSVQYTDPWAKAGVMFRDSTDPSSTFAMVAATPGNGISFQWRNSYAGQCGYTQVGGAAPVWVKLVQTGNDFSAFYSADGANWASVGPSQTVPMNSTPLAGLGVTAHDDSLLCTATFDNLTVSNIPPPAPPVFGVYRELWPNLNSTPGNTLDALTNTAWNPNWPDSPDPSFTQIFTNFETGVNTGMNLYGQRLRTLVVPPADGNYTFWISSDDTSELFLSTDEDPANVSAIAAVPGWTNSREWANYPQQQSAPVSLAAGRRYYLEALMQQGYGGDNPAVRWELPNFTFEEPLTATSAAGTYLVPFTGVDATPGVYQQTTNLTVVEGQNARFSVLVTNQSSVTYQWYVNNNVLTDPNGTEPVYILNNASLALNNGQVYSCQIANSAGATFSAPIPLTVVRDTVPPTVLRTLNVGTNNVQVVFSKLVGAASATSPANYVFTNGLTISAAALGADGQTVTLTTGPLVYGSNYVILISGVRDRASLPNTIAPNSPAAFTALPYTPQDIGNPPIASTVTFATNNGVNVTASGSDIGGLNDQFTLSYQPRNGDFDIALQLAGLNLSDVWAKAGLMARETLDPGSRFAAALATPSMAGCFFEWRDPAYSQANLAGSFPANYPYTWLRLKRSGNTFTGFAGYDGQNWAQLGTASISLPSQLYVGLAVSSHNSTQSTTAQFWNIGNVTSAVVGVVANPHEPLGPSSRLTPVVISEIMYKPAPRSDGNNTEFVELYNSNPYFEDISGFQLAGGSISYTFAPGTILPGGGLIVVAAMPSSITSLYGATNVVGPYSGTLKKSGTVQLLDEQRAILLTVPYSNVYPWPVAADGTGHSIFLANPTYGEGDPRAWAISDVVGGSPGQMDTFHPSPLRSVMLNELLAHSENPAVQQFVELYNHSNQGVDLSGCILTDDPTTNKFVIPSGTTIGPRGFVSFTQSQLGFALNGAGGTVYFIKPDGTRVLDALQYEAQADGISFGRWPNGADMLYPLASRTPGSGNSQLWIGNVVINELMYDPISGNDDDQYIELYNKGTNPLSLAGWQFTAGIGFTFPANATLPANGYLVVARNATNLFAKYPNLNSANTVGDFTGKLSHKGERLALAMPQWLTVTTSQGIVSNTILVVQDEVTYGTGGRWGQWSHGGGSSLELINPNTNHRLAYNWADSDETAKSVWTNLEFTGVLDNGANYSGVVDLVQVGLLDVGECLVDNLEVDPGGRTGANIVANGTFEAGLNGWTPQGDHVRSSLETVLGGYQSSLSLHLRSSDGIWTLGDYVQGNLTDTSLAEGQTATLRLKARWLHGWPEILMRLRGNWLEVTGAMPLPQNLGTPGLPNSRASLNQGPAIYEVKHSPPLPQANQALLVTARFHDFNPFSATLLYRIDTGVNPAPAYSSIPMVDDGTGGDAVAGDGLFSGTIPAQPAGTVVPFLVEARDALGASTLFPQDLTNNAGIPRECVVAFGDPIPTGSFSHHHVFISQNWANDWAQGGGVSHEYHDGTWVDGGGRIIYDWMGRYAGSPYHQYLGSPVTTVGGMHWIVPEDDQLLGTASLNKQHVPGNGPLDDNTLQREQTSYWMAHRIGLGRQNRRFYFYYVNGNRHAPLMEDTQVPGADMLKEYWPNDNNGWLFKNHSWFEGDVAQQSDGYMNFNNMSWCTLGKYTTTINGVPNQYKLARYRWMWWIRQWPDSANDFGDVFALIDAANTPRSSPAYYDNMEALVDTEEWLRLSAMEHATGDWDSLFTQNQWNMYCYKPTMGKWTALKWDWNITLGSGTQTWPPDGSQLFNFNVNDPVLGSFQTYPPYFRAYLRALQDIANLAMNNALVDPVLDAKYAAFVANGLTESSAYGLLVQDPGAAGLKSWIGTMHDSILTALASQGVGNVPFAINSQVINNDVAILTGSAPLQVKTLWFNGVEWPVIWTGVTNWKVTVPLQPGTNLLSIVGVDLHNQTVAGASNLVSVVYSSAVPSPVGQVVINEIMYNPAAPDAQYIELFNSSTTASFDLSGWQLNGVGYTFPAGSLLAPNSFLVLASNPSAFAAAYGGSVAVFDTFPGTLSTTGETLQLLQPTTNGAGSLLIAGVRYGSAPPWPAGANGLGSSLQLIDPHQATWRVGNWSGNGLSPGAPNTVLTTLPLFPPLWLNEVQPVNATGITNSASQRVPWLELYNPSANSVSLSGLYLANNYNNLTQWAFPSGASINPGEFKVIFADGQPGLSSLTELHTSFALANGGSLILSRLYSSQPQVLDYINYPNLLADQSYGSFPDGQVFDRQVFVAATPRAPNNGAAPGSFIPYTAGSTYSQDFNSLPDPGSTSVNAANPVVINGVTNSLANPFGFAFPVSPSGNSGGLGIPALAGWYGLSALTSKFGATDGDQTTGGDISFGPPSSPNRALGLLATSSTEATAFGAKFINQTTTALNYINVQFTGELWRQSNLPKTLQVYYWLDPTATTAFSTNYTALLPALNVSFQTSAAAVGGLAMDGTTAVNQTNLSLFNQAITNWLPGAALWLVWEMPDFTGKSQGLAIDNLSFSASTSPGLVPIPLAIQSAGTNVTITWSTVAGQVYQLQFKDNLNAATWSALGSPIAGSGSPTMITNPVSSSAQRFFRLQIQP